MVVERAEMVVRSRMKIHGRTDKTQIFYNATYIVASVHDTKHIFVNLAVKLNIFLRFSYVVYFLCI